MENSYSLSQIEALSYERNKTFTPRSFRDYLQVMPFEDPQWNFTKTRYKKHCKAAERVSAIEKVKNVKNMLLSAWIMNFKTFNRIPYLDY